MKLVVVCFWSMLVCLLDAQVKEEKIENVVGVWVHVEWSCYRCPGYTLVVAVPNSTERRFRHFDAVEEDNTKIYADVPPDKPMWLSYRMKLAGVFTSNHIEKFELHIWQDALSVAFVQSGRRMPHIASHKLR